MTSALLEKHMKDYDVKITKADKKAIDDAAEEFDKANSQKKKDKVSGSEENVKRVMTLMVIEQKMRSAIVAEANVNVTDEEAVQKHMQYVEFDYTTSSDSSDSSDTTVSDDEKKQVKEKAVRAILVGPFPARQRLYICLTTGAASSSIMKFSSSSMR